jgi:hypothetical protein
MENQSKGNPFSTRASNPRQLAGLLSLAGQPAPQWTADELAAMWKHQLNAPLTYDLGTISPKVGETITMVTRADPRPLEKFGDLFKHPRPPIEILQWTKEFATNHTGGQEEAMPAEIATTLYYASILLARLRLHRKISELSEADLRKGLVRLSRQNWLDQATRDLLADGLKSLESTSENS